MRSKGRAAALIPELLFAGLFAAGGFLYLRGMQLPAFTDHAEAMRVFSSAGFDPGSGACAADEWWRAMDVLRTDRYRLMDTEAGLMLTAATLELIRLWLALSGPEQVQLRTPPRKSIFMILGLATVAMFIVGEWNSLLLDLDRFVFPGCADSIGIPMFGLLILAVLLVAVLVPGGWLIMRGFGPLPSPLFEWDRRRPVRSWLVTLLTGGAAVLGLAAFGPPILTSSFLTAPALVLVIYLLASTQAALLAAAGHQPSGAAEHSSH